MTDLIVYPWHEVGGSGEPSFANSWANLGSGHAVAAFYKDAAGRVHLKGMITTGSAGTIAFTLPAGSRPAEIETFVGDSSGAYGRAQIQVDGDVLIQTAPGANYSLAGVSFRAAA